MWIVFQAVAQKIEKGGLESAEAIVESFGLRVWKRELVGIAGSSKLVDDRAAGVGQRHDFSGFIKGFACRIVDGLSYDLHLKIIPHQHDLRMPARNGEAQKRKLRHLFIFSRQLDEMCQNMRLHVVGFDERQIKTQRKSLGK